MVVATAAVLLAGCRQEPISPSTAAAPASLEPGTVMLPPAGDPELAGLGLLTVSDPTSVPTTSVSPTGYATGWLALYGDPDAEDPFDRPWALAVAQTALGGGGGAGGHGPECSAQCDSSGPSTMRP